MKPLTLTFSLAVLAAGLVAAGCSSAVAQDPATSKDNARRTIAVSGSGSVRVKPDLAVAVLGVNRRDPKLPAAKTAADNAIAQIKAAVIRAGIAEEDVQTVQYNIYHQRANPDAGIRDSAWQVIHMLQIRTKKPETISSIVDAAVTAGATDVQNIEFTVDELAPHRAKAREKAIQAAKEKAQHLASLLGISVGEVLSVSEDAGFQGPMPFAANMKFDAEMGGGGSGISGGQVEVTTNTQVVFEIR